MEVWLEDGLEAEAKSMQGTVLVLLSPKAFAPGSPIRFSIAHDGAERTLEGRTIASKRVHADRFEVRLRLVNLRRQDRERLHGALG